MESKRFEEYMAEGSSLDEALSLMYAACVEYRRKIGISPLTVSLNKYKQDFERILYRSRYYQPSEGENNVRAG